MANRSGVAQGIGSMCIGFALFAAALGGCGKDSKPGSTNEPSPDAGMALNPNAICMPGETKSCQRDELCDGVQRCADDGSAFGECQCDAAGLVGPGIVGARCTTDAQCSGGTCLRADGNVYAGAGGPAGGYCTFSCSGDSDCTSRDSESRCVGLGPMGATYCIRTCLSKDPDPGEAKCLNREDVVCESEASDGASFTADRQQGVCVPRCGSDAECPAGRVCHRQGGICTDVRSPGFPTGTSCTLDTNCDGKACEDRIGGVGVCTAECVLGSLAGCGYGHDDPKRRAACITPLVTAGRFSEGAGDLGLCRELCDVDSDCLQAATGFVCRPITEALAHFTGRLGACVRPDSN